MTDYIRVKAHTAQELLNHFELYEDGAEEHIVADTAPQISIEKLAKAEYYLDSVKLLAHALPKREAVWWACLAARKTLSADTDSENRRALLAAERWAKKPTEENRLSCKMLSERTKHKSASSWAATAACWSTGSLANEGEPEITPPEYLFAHAVAGAVSLAAVQIDPEDANSQYKALLAQGIDLARGGNGESA